MPEKDSIWFNEDSDPIEIIIKGNLSFQNVQEFKALFERSIAKGRRNFFIDCKACSEMDSTATGILAGAGLKLKDSGLPYNIKMTNVQPQVHALLNSLGLDRLIEIRK